MSITKFLKTHPRVIVAFGVAILSYFIIPLFIQIEPRTLLITSLNILQLAFLVLFFSTMLFSEEHKMKQRALKEDDGRNLILAMVLFVVTFTFVSLIYEVQKTKTNHNGLQIYHALLAFSTVALSWLFSHTVFAIHYAHEYYVNLIKNKNAGLMFPQTTDPDYFDFLYFSFVIGATAQTADVSFSNKKMRRIGLLHSLFAYVFNTTILALSINVGASFF